jgi:hypothetical protein
MIYFICVLLFASFTILEAQVSGSWKRLLDFPVYGIGINPKNPETNLNLQLWQRTYYSYK